MEKGLNEILTVDEAADLLRIPRSTVYKLAQLGKIPAQKVGRHWRFHRATLIQWISGKNHPHENNAEYASPLVDVYSPEEVPTLADPIFKHVHEQYPSVTEIIYSNFDI
jgi:excisionase family DNA binding protein